jgi:hypothetical protein
MRSSIVLSPDMVSIVESTIVPKMEPKEAT